MMKTILGVAIIFASVAAAGADDAPFKGPLECMKPFKMKEFPVMAWCFHNYEGSDYNEEYAKNVAAANFNAVVETGYMMDACQKAGLKVLYYSQTEDTLTERDVWGTKRTHPAQKSWATVDWLKENFAKYGKNPALVGYVLNSTYGGQLPAQSVDCAKWLADNKTGLFPWVAYCKDPAGHVKAGSPIFSIECFGRKTHMGFGYDNKGWAHEKRNSYCELLEGGRQVSNKFDMAFWPLFPAVCASRGHGDAPAGNLHGQSEIRFQVLAPIAYGAQGVVYFVYSTTRDVWKPEGTTYKAAQDVNGYVTSVVGPRVLGHRSIGVYCSRPDAPAKLSVRPPKGALAPGEGKLIEKMDEGVMAGVLVAEKDFKSGANTPAYVMLIDARTEVLQNEKDHKPRTLSLTFGPMVKAVEILGAKGEPASRQVGREVSLTLRPGDGRLLRIEAAAQAQQGSP